MRLPTILCALFLSTASVAAMAQSYRCSSDGRTYYSDRPCNNGSTRLQVYGSPSPAPQYNSGQSLRDPPRAQDHIKYLSSACASISEAIRTGPSRGVRGDVIQGLHEEYRQKCAMEDQEARSRVGQDLRQRQQALSDQRDVSLQDQRQAKARMERCAGMRDVIALKRKRESELNDKEVEALRSLEHTYNDICIAK